MLTVEMGLSCLAILLQATAFITWTTLVGKLERWVWMPIWISFVILIYLRLNDVLHWYGPIFDSVLALVLALTALLVSIQARVLLKKREMAKSGLLEVQAKITAAMNGQQPAQSSLANQLAEILVALKDQLQFYESQAKDAGLPPYGKKDGE